MKNALLVLLFLCPSPSFLNIISPPPLVSFSSIALPPSPSLPSLADIRDDLLSLLEQHSAGPQTVPSAISRPQQSESSQTQPKLTRPVIQSGGWKPLHTTTSPPSPVLKIKPSSLPLNLPTASPPSILTQGKASSSQPDHPNALPFSSQLQQLSAIASKKGDGSEKADNEPDPNVDVVKKDLEGEKVKQLDALFREDIVNAGRPLSHA